MLRPSLAISIYLGQFVCFLISPLLALTQISVVYLPTYFQACKDATPTRSGIDVFGLAFTIMPFGIVAGLSVAKFKCYRPQLWVGWVCLIVGAALMSTLNVDSTIARAIGFQIITGLGLGILLTTGFFPVLAPLKVEYNASALAFFMFVRWFSQVGACFFLFIS